MKKLERSSKKRERSSIDPVVVIGLGVFLVAVAVTLSAFRPEEQKISIDGVSGTWAQMAVAFVTGLTTGGLSCLAVQGGLLAGSVAHQVERAYLDAGRSSTKKAVLSLNTATPIILFLLSKTVAYTLLGAILGWLGSFVTLSSTGRAVLMVAVGVFMIGHALRMWNVHPIFRYFTLEPPRFLTRFIRKTARSTEAITPLFLGALTIFLPCGVTQAMMAAALGTGSAGMGAALLFAFTLGAGPLFFSVAWLTTELGKQLERYFVHVVAAIVLALGLVTMNNGLNLMGAPLSLNNLLLQRTAGLVTYSDSSTRPPITPAPGEFFLYVQNQGYVPQILRLPAGKALTLNLVTHETYSCARDFVIPALNVYVLLPASGVVPIAIPAQPKGSRLFFTCSMGMYTGQIVFE